MLTGNWRNLDDSMKVSENPPSKGYQVAKPHHTPELPFTFSASFLNMIILARDHQGSPTANMKSKRKQIRKKNAGK